MSSVRRPDAPPSAHPRPISGLRPRALPSASASGSFVAALPTFTPEECAAMGTAILEQNIYALRTRLSARDAYEGRPRDAAELAILERELERRMANGVRRPSSFPPKAPPAGGHGRGAKEH
jgi:hypothetical protein